MPASQCQGLVAALARARRGRVRSLPGAFAPRLSLAVVTLTLLCGCACASGATAATPDRDRPVPAGEPRAELVVRLDLEPSAECEERFDLALYYDRRVELVAWDDAKGSCGDRLVTIRYLTDRIERAALIERIERLARSVSAVDKPGAR